MLYLLYIPSVLLPLNLCAEIYCANPCISQLAFPLPILQFYKRNTIFIVIQTGYFRVVFSKFTSFIEVIWASLIAQLVKNPPAMQETQVRFLGRKDPLEKG